MWSFPVCETSGLTFSALHRWRVVRPWLGDLSPKSILELGTGSGRFSQRLATDVHFVGVEPDAISRSRAQKLLAVFGGRVVSSLDEVSDKDFDVLCAFEVLEHIEDDSEALRTWLEFVRPGGHVFLSVPAFSKRFSFGDEIVGHYRRYDYENVLQLLGSANLEVVEVLNIGFPLLRLTEFARNRIAAKGLRRSGHSIEERTSRSGRWLQPVGVASPLIRLTSWPFEVLQSLFMRRVGLGTSFVIRARKLS
jgi:SAM-dependent methyltransferase